MNIQRSKLSHLAPTGRREVSAMTFSTVAASTVFRFYPKFNRISKGPGLTGQAVFVWIRLGHFWGSPRLEATFGVLWSTLSYQLEST